MEDQRNCIPPDGPLFDQKVAKALSLTENRRRIKWKKDSNWYMVQPRDEDGYPSMIGVFLNDLSCDEYYFFEIVFSELRLVFQDLDAAIEFFLLTLTAKMRLTTVFYGNKAVSQTAQIQCNGKWIEIRDKQIRTKKPLFSSFRKKRVFALQNDWIPEEEIDLEILGDYFDLKGN